MDLYTLGCKNCLLIFYVVICVLLINFYGNPIRKKREIANDIKYLVDTTNCKIPDIEPFNSDVQPYFQIEEYTSCRELDVLTYIQTDGATAFLKVNTSLLLEYSLTNINCCYSNVTRDENDLDNSIRISDCTAFGNSTQIFSDLIKVTCSSTINKEIFSNVHPIIKQKPSIEPRKSSNQNSYNVLMVGIDTMSSLNLQRTMPKTFTYLEKNNWIRQKGYNKIDDNTFPNLMAILTGMNLSQVNEICHPEDTSLNSCNIIWNRFKANGYVTAYAEDEAQLNTFNYLLKGFEEPPTDYYFRPYFLAAETLHIIHKYFMNYCTGPETSAERILNSIKDFLHNLEDYPKFGMFWMNTFSHNNINTAGCMDEVFQKFWSDLEDSGSLNNTIVVFFSDHGFRFGKIVYTYSGWLEQRLPFNYIKLPQSFQKRYPMKYKNLVRNSQRLSNPYDIYMTLQDIIKTSNEDYQVQASLACPKCKSLFEVTPEARTCEDASISQHWCTCKGHIYVDPSVPLVRSAVNFVLVELDNQIKSYNNESVNCASYFFRRIITAGIREGESVSYLLLIFETFPKAVFEATVSFTYRGLYPRFNLQGVINRVDRYSGKSNCVNNRILKALCYCDSIFTKLQTSLNILFNW